MRKVIATVIVLLILVLGVLPYGMGLLAKSSLEKFYKDLPAGLPFTVAVKNYRMGWFSSEADLEIKFKNANQQAQFKKLAYETDAQGNMTTPRWVIRDHVQHGPILISRDFNNKVHWDLGRAYVYTRLIFDENTADVVKKYLGDLPVVHSSTLITLTGKFDGFSEIFPIKFKKDNYSVDWQGMQHKGVYTVGFTKLQGTLSVLPLQVTGPDFNLSSGNLVANFDGKLDKKLNIMTGTSSFDLPNFTIHADNHDVVIQNLQVNNEQSISSNLLSGNFKAAVAKVIVNNQTYGPGQLDFNIKKLDAKAYSQLLQAMNKINDDQDLSLQQKNAEMMMLIPSAFKIIAQGAAFSVNNLKLNTPSGLVSLQGNITFPEMKEPPKNMIAAIQQLQKSVTANVSLQLPGNLVQSMLTTQALANLKLQSSQSSAAPSSPSTGDSNGDQTNTAAQDPQQQASQQAQAKLANLVAQGWLVKDGDQYKLDASYKQGKITINGKAINGAALPLP